MWEVTSVIAQETEVQPLAPEQKRLLALPCCGDFLGHLIRGTNSILWFDEGFI